MGSNNLLLSLFVLVNFVIAVNCHGRMRDPPSRASMWRSGFDNPQDYNDNQGFCGGAQNQKKHGGKCGVCGDPYQGPRTHEPGKDNKYANGIIVKEYKTNEVIQVTIQITAHHKGYFEFRLSPSEDNLGTVSQTDLNRYVLEVKGGGTRYYLPNSGSGDYNVQLHLPAGLTCSHCVLQWIYHTGNSWGCDADGACGLGSGAQEEFRACADVRILGEDGETPATKPPTTSQPTTKSSTTSAPSPPKKTTSRLTSTPTTRVPTTRAPTTRVPTTRAPTRKSTTGAPTKPSSTILAIITKRATPRPSTLEPKRPAKQCISSTGSVCSWRSAGPWRGQGPIDDWCSANCPGPTCDGWQGCGCECEDEEPFQPKCRAAGAWEGDAGMDQWCSGNCPSNCPTSHCKCDL